MKKRTIIKDILYLFKPYWQYSKSTIIVSALVSLLCPSLATVGSVIYQQTVVTALANGHNLKYILMTTIWLSIIIFVPQIITTIVDTCVTTLSFEKVEKQIKKEIYDKAKNTDYKYFDSPDFYDNYTWTINERVQKANEARGMIISFFSSISTITSIIGVIVSQDFIIVIITIISLMLSLFLGSKNNKLLYEKQEENLRPYRVLSYINRIFYDKIWAADIKTTNISKKLMREFEKSYEDIFHIIKKYQGKIALNKSMMLLLSLVVQLTITMHLCYQVLSGKIQIGSFVGLIAASSVLKERLGVLFNFVQNSNKLSYYVENLKHYEKLISPIENCVSSDSLSHSDLYEIEFKNIEFSYPNSSFKLKDINLKIKKGEKIAIVGENGGGKTTLTKLLLRLYDPDGGEILINGKNIKEYDIHSLREHVGIAPQTPNIYAMSFRDNITLYTDFANNQTIEEISEIFDLHKILSKTNATVESPLTREFDDDGILLSGGELQKLALARLYVKEFGLIILDEPSSALDPISEYELNKIIFDTASNVTTIMIAHRLSNIRDADCIYLINNGKIVETGTHNELMAQKGEYFEMFKRQSEKYIEP